MYSDDGGLVEVAPLVPAAPRKVLKRMLAKLPPPPIRLIVPNIEIVHNRVSVEIMRGCTRGCRFCLAGMVTRPVREREVEEVVDAAEQAVRLTGVEELALLSLSSSDYTHILRLVTAIGERFADRPLKISLPSLRIETVSIDLMEGLKARRAMGFTLAPEAASERMRRTINKFIPDEQILKTVGEIFSRGWKTIKLYFMIGHPTETLEDVRSIANLCKSVLAEGRRFQGGKAKVHVSVATFVPKPHTPFQWVAGDTIEKIQSKQALLMHELRDKNIKLSWTEPRETLLEACLSRGDRRLAEVIFRAWKNGAVFDAWSDHFRYEAWMDAFSAEAIDPAFYVQRQRAADEVFPWDHISAGVEKKYLYEDFRRSLAGEIHADCRERCDACGILLSFSNARRNHPGEHWKCPEIKDKTQRTEIRRGTR